ncbi:MAG: threonine--tRNA ligase [Chlamydiales bacterium]|nr:threonine--tRNA ligase [Chlamydiales bacterium]
MQIFHDDCELKLTEGDSAQTLAEILNLREPDQALAAIINGQVVDLAHKLKTGDKVQFINFDTPAGKEIFWHSSAHVLAQAILRLYPDAKPTIGPPIKGGFYYDFANLSISEEDFPKIEAEIQKILKENHRPERTLFEDRKSALASFCENPYKCELIESFEDGPITGYKQGEFFDLCRGPHLPNLGKIKAFKLLKTSGAYWRGDSKNAMLTRIYGISFPDRKLLKDHLHLLEEAKKRDHRLLGTKLDLYSFHEEAPAMPFIHPKGMIIWNHLLAFWRELHTADSYEEIQTPLILTKELWETSGHWEHYRENMYTTEIEERTFAIKPMNCPGCMIYYSSKRHSYRDFPLKVAELGRVHRYEPSGAVNGMFRVRSFLQDDAHIFMTQDQITDCILNVLQLVEKTYSAFGLNYRFELSTRPDKKKTIGSDKDWQVATDGLRNALDAYGKPYQVNEGDGAFYGPKIDLHIQDALDRSWQCGTIQLDMSLPERFDLEYTDSDGQSKRPIMIHRAIFGSIERFYGIIVEHFAGKFPLWLSPRQVAVIPVADRHNEYAYAVSKELSHYGLACETYDAQESVSKKVRKAQTLQTNYMLTVGDQEVENNTVTVRTRDNVVHGELKVKDFAATITKELKSRALSSPYTNKES